MAKATQAGKLGHYTWIIDEIMIEEAEAKTEASSYVKPFDKVTNSHGIQIASITNEVAQDLIGLLGYLVGINLNVPNAPSESHLQLGKIKDNKNRKNIERLRTTMITLASSDYINSEYAGEERPGAPGNWFGTS